MKPLSDISRPERSNPLEAWALQLRQCGWEYQGDSESPPYARNDLGAPDPSALGAMGVTLYEVWTPGGLDGPRLALAQMHDNELPNPDRQFARYLDCPRKIRQALDVINADGWLDFCLISDNRREYWYDALNDACMGAYTDQETLAHGPSRMREKIWPRLTPDCARQGKLEAILHRPSQALGDELSSWLTLWINEMGGAAEDAGIGGQTLWPDINRLFLTFLLIMKTIGHGDARRPIADAWSALLMADEDDLVVAFLDSLTVLLGQMGRRHPSRLTADAAGQWALVKALADARPRLIRRLAEELPALSNRKLTTEALVEALGDPQIEMGAWRQALTIPCEELERALHVEGRHILNPLRIQVDQDGQGWLMRCARWATRYWRQKIEAEADWRGVRVFQSPDQDDLMDPEARATRELHWQLDMTMPWPLGVNPDGRVINIMEYALGNSLRIDAEKPLSRFISELLIYALVLEETCEEADHLFLPIDLAPMWNGSSC